uniref:ATP synthase complex subunit 8 n=1 Tax=Cassidinae sp. ACP-2018 TaxID=2480630 RepID=A0A3G5FNQ8_9CUCU|nr:ATP synthase F0 subunit 8 [Cassidinae sp. ACP-2018]
MPQMAPMNWLMLLITMITILLILNSMIYFTVNNHPSNTKIKFNKNINWKW